MGDLKYISEVKHGLAIFGEQIAAVIQSLSEESCCHFLAAPVVMVRTASEGRPTLEPSELYRFGTRFWASLRLPDGSQ